MRYSVAVKRKFRDEIPEDWVERLSACDGLKLEGGSEGLSPRFGRLMIEATAQGLEQADAEFGEMLHIEPVITHETSDAQEAGDKVADEPLIKADEKSRGLTSSDDCDGTCEALGEGACDAAVDDRLTDEHTDSADCDPTIETPWSRRQRFD